MKYESISEFEADFKKLAKRYRSLPSDFEDMKESLLDPHFEQGIPVSPKALVDIEGFGNDNYRAMKIRRFSCDSLKNRGGFSGIRVVFVLQKQERIITFIEIYYKGDKENEDRKRLKRFVENLA
jgi:mRNA-degrading endonuclease RelE of RelBE toxin-antitoxin system